jgi:hypothetical protein
LPLAHAAALPCLVLGYLLAIALLVQGSQTAILLGPSELFSVPGGVALVPLIKDSCGGCHMVQPPQILNEAYLRAKLVMCDSCARILYVDDPTTYAPSL